MPALRDDNIDLFFGLLEEQYEQDFHSEFRILCAMGQRIGQAFMNSLPKDLYIQLYGTSRDPFHSNQWGSVYDAIEFLTTK